MAASRSDGELALACSHFRVRTATVMPRPMAAGVFGIARTIAVPAGNAFCRKVMVRPAMIDTASVDLPTNGPSARHGFRRVLRLDRDHDRGCFGDFLCGIERHAAPRQRLDGLRGMWLEYRRACADQGRARASPRAWPSPSFQRQARPDGRKVHAAACRQALLASWRRLYRHLRRYASPDVSNIVASSASRAAFPAQTTNWKAVK